LSTLALPFRANCPTNADRFRQIFRDHWDRWCDLRLEDGVPADQRAYVRETVRRMMLCRDADVRVGMIYVTHSFGRDLGFKPHVHLVTPAPTAGAV
jgi:hypothetical protein